MHVGLDIDGTITKHPALFASLSKGLRADGHKVSIITYRFEGYYLETMKELEKYGVSFDSMHMLPSDGDQPTMSEYKRALCEREGIDVLFDDAFDVLVSLPDNTNGIGVL